MFNRRLLAFGILATVVFVARLSAQTMGSIFYTTADGNGLEGTADKVSYSFTGTSLTLGSPVQLRSFGKEGVDAFSFLPNGNLLIGGRHDVVHDITRTGALVGDF